MSSLLSAELSATCNALGTYNKKTGKYLIDEYTINTVKDLIRYLKRDGEDHEIRRHIGQTKVLQKDLIPMLKDHWENNELFDVTLRLLVNLTNPALLLYREEIPTERTAHHNYLQILSHLQCYKEEAFTKVATWTVFANKLTNVLEIDWSERDEDTGLIIERILILIRNVLHVPADLDYERKPENDASVHDQVLWALNSSGILDIIFYMSSENEKQYFMHILEIISHLLREQNPTSLSDSELQRSVDEKLSDERELLKIRNAETKQKNEKLKRYSSVRHSRFGGTYVIQNMKSISENEMICYKPLNNVADLDFGGKKDKFVKPKNRRPTETGVMERRSPFAVRLFLRDFCIRFLNGSYNTLMHHVKDVLVRAKAQQNDESYYLWAVKFFMEFNRGHNFNIGLVSETMSVPMFHYVQQQMEKYYDMIKVEKKKFTIWVRRLHLALRAYKELLNTLMAMEKSPDSTVGESAKVLKSNIFYVLEYREFVLATLLSYDENKMPRSYIIDLIQTVHLFLKMLENYCKITSLVVQKKVRKKSNKNKKFQPKKKPSQPVRHVERPAWEEVRPQLAVVLNSHIEEYPPPFDAASDVPIDEQKEDCIKNIQKHMATYKFENAVGMFRAAREVWPEGGIFGEDGIPVEEELEMLESIYTTDLGVEIETANITNDDTQSHSEDENDEEDEEEKSTAVVETDFDFKDFISRFCHPKVVSACVSLLETYDHNSTELNHCIVKLLHRIAWDCKRPSMLFQATLFLIFQRLLHNPSPEYKELEKLAIFIFRKFTETASTDSKVFIELLFWKSIKDSNEIELGYDIYSDAQPGKGIWTEEQEEELRKLFMENQQNPATDKDVIDWIMENLIDQTRTRRGVIKKLKDLGLIFKAPTKKSHARERVPLEFSEEEDEKLKELWEEFAQTIDPMDAIVHRMPRKRPKKSLIERLLQLNIIRDKKECRKKRPKKSEHKSENDNSDIGSTSDTTSQSDSENENQNKKNSKHISKATKNKLIRNSNKNMMANKKNNHSCIRMTASQVGKILINAVQQGLSEPLKWLAECLEEVALDQEAEGFNAEAEGIPLVPISHDCAIAMENDTFKKVLRGMGINPPDTEQETYWRIPASIHFETLRKRREVVLKAVEKTLVVEDDKMNDGDNIVSNNTNKVDNSQLTVTNGNESSEDDDDSVFDNLRKIREMNAFTYSKKSEVNKHRKRSRSLELRENEKKCKVNKTNSNDDGDNNDILSFAKKTLMNGRDFPDTEDILSDFPKENLGFTSDEDKESSDDEDIVPSNPKKKRRVIIDDDSN